MTKLVFCACSEYHLLLPSALRRLLVAARAGGHEVDVVDDLCHLAATSPGEMARLALSDAIVACHPRAVRGLFGRCGLDAPRVLNLRVDEPASIASELALGALPVTDAAPASEAAVAAANPAPADGWVAWYPVVDYSRCVNCGKCVDFCVFGVYSRDDQGVHVSKPDGCKTNCPACARMCPARAIMFPKIAEEPINGAEPATDKAGAVAAPRAGGLMDALRSRNAVKKRLFKDDSP